MSGTIPSITTRTTSSSQRDRFRSLLISFPLLSVAALTLGMQQSASAAVFDVDNSTALIQALTDANANGEADVINLAAGTYTLTDVASEQIDLVEYTDPDGTVTIFEDDIYGPNGLPLIESEVTIKASSGAAVIERSGAEVFRFFHVRPGATLELEGVTLRGGRSDPDRGREQSRKGGAILNQGTTVVSDSVFTDNTGGREGGAIQNRPGATLEIHSSVFEGNKLTHWFSYGGAINNVKGIVSIDQSTFKNNHTCLPPDCREESGDGGAIANTAGEMTITNSTFVGNKSISGGAVENGRGKLVIVNSSFFGNVALNWGGAIGSYAESDPSPERDTKEWGDGVLVIINSTIAGNHAGDFGVGKSGASTYGGGGLLNQKGVVVLKNTILAGNTAPAGMAQDCTGYPYFHHNPVYILSAGHNIIGDTDGCLTVPVEMPYSFEHDQGGAPLLLTLETDASTDLLGGAGVGALDAGADLPGRGHMALTSTSAAINAGANDTSVILESECVGGSLVVSGLSQDQLGNAAALEVRDIGAVEYTGAAAAPAALLPLSLAPFDPLPDACAGMKVKEAVGSDGGVTDVAGNSTSTETNTQTDTSVAVGQSVSQAPSTSGGGAWGPWGILSLGVATLGVRLRRRRAVS